MPYQSYRDLIAWQLAFDLAVEIYRLTRAFPRDERFGLTSQVRRAAVSISNNIAEGHGRATRGEFLYALSVARGSTNEVQNCLLLSQSLEFASAIQTAPLLDRVERTSQLLAKLRLRVKEKEHR